MTQLEVFLTWVGDLHREHDHSMGYGNGMFVAANRGSNCSFTRAMDGRIVRCDTIGSCQSAAISKIVKALLVLSPFHVRSAIASTELYLYLTQLTDSIFVRNLLQAIKMH